MERKVKRIPPMDSVEKLAEFWDSHDVTDFDDDLEIASERIFARKKSENSVAVELEQKEAAKLRRLAKSKGVKESALVRQWIRERLDQSSAPQEKVVSPVRRAQ